MQNLQSLQNKSTSPILHVKFFTSRSFHESKTNLSSSLLDSTHSVSQSVSLSITQPASHSFTHSLTHSLITHSLTHWLTQSTPWSGRRSSTPCASPRRPWAPGSRRCPPAWPCRRRTSTRRWNRAPGAPTRCNDLHRSSRYTYMHHTGTLCIAMCMYDVTMCMCMFQCKQIKTRHNNNY